MVGVSADKPETQRKFIDKFSLTFPMISDTARSIIPAYGASKVLGVTAARKTVLVDPDGKVAHVWPKVNVLGHAEDVLETVKRLAAARG